MWSPNLPLCCATSALRVARQPFDTSWTQAKSGQETTSNLWLQKYLRFAAHGDAPDSATTPLGYTTQTVTEFIGWTEKTGRSLPLETQVRPPRRSGVAIKNQKPIKIAKNFDRKDGLDSVGSRRRAAPKPP